MNIPFQIAKHLEATMQQWPFLDREKEEAAIREALVTGQAWLYYEYGDDRVVTVKDIPAQSVFDF